MSLDTLDQIHLDYPYRNIARIRLTSGATLNTLTWETMDALMKAFGILKETPPRALIITGEGKVFCGGAYLKYFTDPASALYQNPEGARDPYVRRILDVFGTVQHMPWPTIAAINGHALGGGMEMAIACDFRLLSQTASMGQPEVRHGLAPGGNGIQQLVRLIGRQRALEMVLSGAAIKAETALEYGLALSVHDPEDLDDAALAFAKRFLASGPKAVAITKRAVRRAEDATLEDAAEIALDAVYESFSTDESREGLEAFVEKRRAAHNIADDTG